MNEPQEFAKRKEAAAWLIDQGWKISRSTFYKHCSEGRVRPNASGGFGRAALLRYARLHLAQMDKFQSLEAAQLTENKLKAEVVKLEEQSKLAKLKREQLEGTLVPRAEVELQLAGRAAALESSLKYALALSVPTMVEVAAGNPDQQQELIEMLNKTVDAALTEYAAPVDIEVLFVTSESEARQ
jgi:hypothetical protein